MEYHDEIPILIYSFVYIVEYVVYRVFPRSYNHNARIRLVDYHKF